MKSLLKGSLCALLAYAGFMFWASQFSVTRVIASLFDRSSVSVTGGVLLLGAYLGFRADRLAHRRTLKLIANAYATYCVLVCFIFLRSGDRLSVDLIKGMLASIGAGTIFAFPFLLVTTLVLERWTRKGEGNAE